MKKTVKLVLVGVGAILTFSTSSFAQETIRITNGEWRPFLSENLKQYGVLSHIITTAFSSEGINVEYGFFPWARSYTFVKTGKWDGSVVWSRTPEKENEVYFSDPVFISKDVFFHLKSYKFDWNTIDDLKGITVGATIKYTYGKKFDNAEKVGELLVDRVPSDLLNFKKLLKERIQIFPMNIDAGYSLIQEQFKPENAQLFTNHSKPTQKFVYHLILSKKVKRNREMLKLFNKGLKRLRDNGKYARFFEASRRGDYIIKK